MLARDEHWAVWLGCSTSSIGTKGRLDASSQDEGQALSAAGHDVSQNAVCSVCQVAAAGET